MSRPDFDKVVPPISNRSRSTEGKQGGFYSASGTDVEVQIRFFKIMEVDPANGAMRLKVWLRMFWTDERLAWDPAAYGNVTTTYYQAGHFANAGEGEIWVPDVQPYNSRVGIAGHSSTLDITYVRAAARIRAQSATRMPL